MKIFNEFEPICDLVVGLIDTKEELLEAQKLRYKKLVLDYDNTKDENGTDESEYDFFCDHLIVKDTKLGKIVGTYRLMTKEHFKYKNKFICEDEFDIEKLKNTKDNILELGRAVVDETYRNGVVIKLLWKAIFHYCAKHNVKYMFGTASFHGVDFNKYKNAFSSLYYNNLADNEIMCYAKQPFSKLDLLKIDEIDMVKYKEEMPSLIRGYLALGSQVGNGVYLDKSFNSADVMMIFDLDKLNVKYAERMFGVTI